MEYLMLFDRYIQRKWRRKINRNKRMNSKKPIFEPVNPDEMTPGRTYDQTEPDIPGSFTLKV